MIIYGEDLKKLNLKYSLNIKNLNMQIKMAEITVVHISQLSFFFVKYGTNHIRPLITSSERDIIRRSYIIFD